MATIVASTEIGQGPDVVFSYVTDPSRFSEWQKGVISGATEGGPPSVGSKCTMTRQIGGAERTSTSEITEVSPPKSWAIRGLDGPIRAVVNVNVESLSDGARSRVTIKLNFEGHGIGKLLAPIVTWQARREAPKSCRNLKELLESRD